MSNKTRNSIGWVLTGVLALPILASSISKLSGAEAAVKIAFSSIVWIAAAVRFPQLSARLFGKPMTAV